VPDLVVEDLWLGHRFGPSRLVVDEDVVTRVEAAAPGTRGAPGGPTSVMPGLIDHHVHLGLVDHTALAHGRLVEVHDLGWNPAGIASIRADPPAGVVVRAAGPFHTAPGGYPSQRPWAPDGSVRAIVSVEDIRRAVADAAAYDAVVFKITLHSAMPTFDDTTLRTLVDAVHAAGLRVGIHAEGVGQAARAIEARADVLVHAPWTERLPDELLARAVPMTWCSTVAIHDPRSQAVAVDNLRRFRAQGGRIVYGTDMGNGPTPVGPNDAEILALGRAGLEGDALLVALTGIDGGPQRLPVQRLLASPHPLPRTATEVVSWLADSRRLTVPFEEHHDR